MPTDTENVLLTGITMHMFGPRWSTGQPLWEAEITVTAHGPTSFRDARTVFIPANGPEPRLPGTIVVHAVVNHVHLRYGNSAPATFGVRPGQTAAGGTFMLQIKPNSWESVGGNKVVCRHAMCIAGQFPLRPYLADVPEPWKTPFGSVFPQLSGITDLEAASSGLLLTAIPKMPDGKVLTRPLPFLVEVAKPQGDGDLIIRADPERLYSNLDTSELAAYFSNLQARLNPQSGNQARLRWQRLELTDPTRLPEFWWYLSPGDPTTLRFAEGEWRLLFADQDLTAKDNPTRGVLDGAPKVTITNTEVRAVLGTNSTHAATGVYRAAPAGAAWDEHWSFTDLHFGYDAVDTAARLRRTLGVPTPRIDDRDELSSSDALTGSLPASDGFIDPPWLWAGIPLGNGWAQIPVFNLTEQILVQALPEPWVTPISNPPAQVLRGSAIYGNDRAELYARENGDLPWNFTLLSAEFVEGSWKFNAGQELTAVEITLRNPQVTSEGMFWMATTPPTANDALPTLDNWVGGLETIPLRTHGIRHVYPSPFEWYVPELNFKRMPAANDFDCAKLQASTWTYQVSTVAHTGRVNQQRIPPQDPKLPDGGKLQLTASIYFWLTALADAPYQAKLKSGEPWQTQRGKPRVNGLVWQHHPTQPSVQTLPLTQSNVPANYPSASRQFLPFDLPLSLAPLPAAEFKCSVQMHEAQKDATGSLGAEIPIKVPTFNPESWTWQCLDSNIGWHVVDAHPNSDCKEVLALAMLSLPGVVLRESENTQGIADPTHFLKRLHYRHDLPLLDQVNALADLPPEGPPAPQITPAPLLREGYQRHWRILEEKGTLATVDEADALVTEAGNPVVRGLAEPRVWPVKITVHLDQYPGSLEFADALDESNVIVLEAEGQDALRGLDGGFVEQGNNLRLVALGTPATVRVVGGSTELMQRGDQLRDQRGLSRSATDDNNPHLLVTRLSQPASDLSLLTLTQQALTLVAGSATWQLWFKDLPVKGTGPFSFLRTDTNSTVRRGVNDPQATGRDLGPWNGYEWRVAPMAAHDKPWLRLGQLRFYPLSLEEVRLQSATPVVANRVVILGRLELPAWDGQSGVAQPERPLLDSVVQITFVDGELIEVIRAKPDWEEDPTGKPMDPAMWPLVDRTPETESPVLLWSDRTDGAPENLLQSHPTLGPSIIVRGDRLSLAAARYGLMWQVPAKKESHLIFPIDGSATPSVNFQVPSLAAQQSGIERLTLTLNLATGLHRLTADWLFRIGSPTELSVEARYADELLAPGTAPASMRASLRHGTADPVPLNVPPGNPSFESGGLELVWQDFKRPTNDLQVLPGISLEEKNDACWGSALLVFKLQEQPASVPQVLVSGGFVSVLLRCVWGTMLQEATTQPFIEADFTQAAFNACAGSVLAEYTSTFQTAGWQSDLTLSGLVEVKNLVSWPTSFAVQPDNSLAFDKPAGTLDHVRHTARILMAEHRIPHSILRGGTKPNCILTLKNDACWNFRAVVEHQIVPLTLTAEAHVAALPESEIRWTVSQDVRWITPPGLYNHLATTRASRSAKAPDTDLASTSWEVLERRNMFDGLEQSSFWAALNLTNAGNHPPFEETALAKFADALLVDASVPLFLRQRPLTSAGGTQLFPLTGAVVLSGCTSLADFTYPETSPGDTWQFLSVPFFGRLQGPTPQNALEPMVEDPVLAVHRTSSTTIGPLVCALTHYFNTPLALKTTLFDQPALRRFRRLDASAVAEGWMRLQRARAQLPTASKAPGSTFQIVTADTTVRLASCEAIDSLFDPNRASLPPQRGRVLGSHTAQTGFVWTPKAIHAVQVAISPITRPEQFPFLTLPLMLQGSERFDQGLVRYPAATLLPTHSTAALQPTSLALVPFSQLSLQILPSKRELFLATCELLAFDAQRENLGIVATHVIHQSETTRDVAAVEAQLRNWATATHARMAADSPCAILRVRLLFEQGEQVAVQAYYLAVPVNIAPPLAPQRASAILASPERLRQRQGQLNLAPLPLLSQLQSFELAPPLVRGAQPVRLNARPTAAITWPWGWSGVRMSMAYRGDQRGTVGNLIPAELDAAEYRLWWQAIAAQVQFAIPEKRDLLPQYFRAPAIPGYLPAAHSVPLPPVELLKEHIAEHQPVLPGARYVLATGMRPGAPYAFRETLSTQWLSNNAMPASNNTSQVSGQVVLQMRAPRPILLPPNDPSTREKALQTWGSWFEVTHTVRHSANPEAEFFTLDNEQPKAMRVTLRQPIAADFDDLAEEEKVKQLLRASKASGACELPATWDGSLFLDFTELAGTLTEWDIEVQLYSGNSTFYYEQDTPLGDTKKLWYAPTKANQKLVEDWFDAQPDGQEAVVAVTLKVPSQSVQGSRQTARLPVRVTKSQFPLPFANCVLTFEDPEYNRELASTPIRTEKLVPIQADTLATLVFAVDRGAYNTTGTVHCLFYFASQDAPGDPSLTGVLTISRRTPDGSSLQVEKVNLQVATLGLFDLATAPLHVGDELLFELKLPSKPLFQDSFSLRIPIVAAPTTPSPEAGYALLRRTERAGSTKDECRRFAWGPDATRIELLDPSDLKRQIVRRRAVFVWNDTHRVSDMPLTKYAIQKSTMRGSTHFPPFPLV